MVGTGRGATEGILFKNSDALETAQKLTAVMFDKTGTITRGKPVLTDWRALDGADGEALALAASAEDASEHPIARAVAAGARERGARLSEAEEFRSHSGFGVEATVGGRRVRVGKPAWFEEDGGLAGPARQAVEELSGQGKTVMLAEVDGAIAGVLAVADQEKKGARQAVAEVRELGLTPMMLTGDQEQAARAVAHAVGIEEVEAGVLPERKEEVVRRAQERGHKVAMVGDGINDAPALARADVGIAIGGGTDVAMEAADITLVGGEVGGVPRAIALSRGTMRTIKQNLFWAFFYNVALVPVAAGVLHGVHWLPALIRDLHPVLAAGAMAASSVTVVLNSLRLARARL
jgi:Cu+-exporting ATPase